METLACTVAWVCSLSSRARRLGRLTPTGGSASTPTLGAMLDVSLIPTSHFNRVLFSSLPLVPAFSYHVTHPALALGDLSHLFLLWTEAFHYLPVHRYLTLYPPSSISHLSSDAIRSWAAVRWMANIVGQGSSKTCETGILFGQQARCVMHGSP